MKSLWSKSYTEHIPCSIAGDMPLSKAEGRKISLAGKNRKEGKVTDKNDLKRSFQLLTGYKKGRNPQAREIREVGRFRTTKIQKPFSFLSQVDVNETKERKD